MESGRELRRRHRKGAREYGGLWSPAQNAGDYFDDRHCVALLATARSRVGLACISSSHGRPDELMEFGRSNHVPVMPHHVTERPEAVVEGVSTRTTALLQ